MNKLETARNTLTGAQKWTQKKFSTPGGTRHCLLGAMYGIDATNNGVDEWDVDFAAPEVRVLAEVIAEQYPERMCYGFCDVEDDASLIVVSFNDHRDTSFADVDRVLDKAVVKSQELI